MKMLNLGCGNNFHKDWINIDFVSNNEFVSAYNLLNGIPFEDESFEIVYHSHLLEHFSRQDAKFLIKECYRVLKQNGIIRIAVPDLEIITREYIKNLERAINKEPNADYDYDWILLEMYDQTVRNQSGGEMANYIFQNRIANEDYVYQRVGFEAKNLRENYFKWMEGQKNMPTEQNMAKRKKESISKRVIAKIKRMLLKDELEFYKRNKEYVDIGKFRLSGEIHQWMYDQYSLTRLLKEFNFRNICKKTANESNIVNWSEFKLEMKDNLVLKPDSLFMEACK